LDHPPFIFEINNFEAGTLTASAISGAKVIAKSQIQTPEKASGIKLVLDSVGRDFVADGSDIILAYAYVVDRNGTTIEDAERKIHFHIDGQASIVGDGMGIGANPMFTEYGVAPILIQAGSEAGKISLTAKAEGLQPDKIEFNSILYAEDTAEPIYDFESVKVDLGASDQLRQFDWTAWNGEDNQNSERSFEEMGGFSISLEAASPSGILRWLGEMNVIGKYGFVYGDGVLGIDEEGIILGIQDLPAGTYKLTSWHHAPRSNTDSMDPNKEKMKKLKIPSIPYEEKLFVSVEGQQIRGLSSSVSVSEGKNMQFDPPATHVMIFRSDGKNPLKIHFKGETNKGIWLNGFKLSEWDFEKE
ncbi:MAG: glycoside hydrolase family 2, partial [Bacteroidota bacterium]